MPWFIVSFVLFVLLTNAQYALAAIYTTLIVAGFIAGEARRLYRLAAARPRAPLARFAERVVIICRARARIV